MTTLKIKLIANNWSTKLFPAQIQEMIDTFAKFTGGKAILQIDVEHKNFSNVPFSFFAHSVDPVAKIAQDITAVDLMWYRKNIQDPNIGYDATILVMNPKDWRGNVQGLMSWADYGRPIRISVQEDGDFQLYKDGTGIWCVTKLVVHELCHALFFITGQTDTTHYFDYTQPEGLPGAYKQVDYTMLEKTMKVLRSRYPKSAKNPVKK